MTAAATMERDARTRLLDAAMQVIRAQGYSATTVDDICRAARLTKGAFFHHFESKEDLAVAAAAHFSQMAETLHAAGVARDIAAAKALYAPDAPWSAESLALHTQAVLQGAFVLAKAKHGPEVARECVSHLRRYIESLFHRPGGKKE